MVEFAFAVTVFMLLVLGIIQFSLLYFVSSALKNATRDAARYGSVITLQPRTGQTTPRSEAQAKEDILAKLKASASGLDVSRLDTSVSFVDNNGAQVSPAPDVKVKLSTSYRVPNIAPMLPWASRQMSASSTMRLEAQS